MNVDKRPEPWDWKLCTCDKRKTFTGGQEGPMEGIRRDVNSEWQIIRPELTCPERAKPGHPRVTP